jgi:hypothetical protein
LFLPEFENQMVGWVEKRNLIVTLIFVGKLLEVESPPVA